jgi:hypothetical protein
MAIAKVPENREVEFLNEFCSKSMFTFEGIDIDSKEGKKSLKELEELLRKTGFTEKEFIGYRFSGEVMNRNYGLTQNNAYPDGVTFLVIPNYYNPVVKLKVGARWFDDIVANNKIRQNAINFDSEPDFGASDE